MTLITDKSQLGLLKKDLECRGYMLRKFCSKCKIELSADSKYLLCENCHKQTLLSEDDREFYENSRLHY